MLSAERRAIISELLQKEKRVVVAELSERFSVSGETIRRDLARLEKEGVANKSYGGATLASPGGETPLNIRRETNIEGKRRIAQLIVDIVAEREHIILDPSTTALAIIKALKVRKNLTVVTNSLEVLGEIGDMENWEILATGGTYRGRYLAMEGLGAINGIKSFFVDKAIISCKGIDMDRGVADSNEMFSQMKSAMLSSAKEKILAVDYSKFNVPAFSRICDMSEIDMLVTDREPDAGWMDYFCEKGVKVIY